MVMHAKYQVQCLTKSDFPINVDNNENDDEDDDTESIITLAKKSHNLL